MTQQQRQLIFPRARRWPKQRDPFADYAPDMQPILKWLVERREARDARDAAMMITQVFTAFIRVADCGQPTLRLLVGGLFCDLIGGFSTAPELITVMNRRAPGCGSFEIARNCAIIRHREPPSPGSQR